MFQFKQEALSDSNPNFDQQTDYDFDHNQNQGSDRKTDNARDFIDTDQYQRAPVTDVNENGGRTRNPTT